MLAKRIIPCLDVKDGRVVKGINFVELRDAGDPVEAAALYDEQGADELTFLDITASHEQRDIMITVVSRTAEQVFIPLTVGGGINSLETIRGLLLAGADKVSINTAAVRNPEFVRRAAERFGSQCIVVAIDAKRRKPSTGTGLAPAADEAPTSTHAAGGPSCDPGYDPGCDLGWEVYTHGGRTPTGLDAVAWARRVVALGAGEILLTSMDRDGTKIGYDLELTSSISDAVSVPVIASGGVGNAEHLLEGVTKGHADAVLAASIFHYGEYTIGEVKRYLHEAGVAVRLTP